MHKLLQIPVIRIVRTVDIKIMLALLKYNDQPT